MCKSSISFSPPRFRLVPPHFGCSGDGTGLWSNRRRICPQMCDSYFNMPLWTTYIEMPYPRYKLLVTLLFMGLNKGLKLYPVSVLIVDTFKARLELTMSKIIKMQWGKVTLCKKEIAQFFDQFGLLMKATCSIEISLIQCETLKVHFFEVVKLQNWINHNFYS